MIATCAPHYASPNFCVGPIRNAPARTVHKMLSQANSLGLLSSTSSDTLRRRSKREEQARQAQALSCQRQIVLRKEQELAELREALAAQEGELSTLVKQVGARSQRVDVATLCGTPSIKQVGCEMAAAIRRRQERRKQALREKLHKMQSKLDHDIAHNRTLRQEIEERRHARLHHMAAVNIGGKQARPAPAPRALAPGLPPRPRH